MKSGVLVISVLLAGVIPSARADWKDDIGYNILVGRLGGATPTGAGITVTQVEANFGGSNPMWIYHPDETLAEFAGKSFTNKCTTCDNTSTSSHATTVASYYYGNTIGIAPGITVIDVNEANNWINNYLHFGSPFDDPVETRRVENCSWIFRSTSGITNAQSDEINRRLDMLIQNNGVVCAVGADNGAATATPLNLAPAYNVLAVGLTSGGSSYGPVVAGIDGAGRVKPDIVAPDGPSCCTSFASPRVASCAVLLLQTEDNVTGLTTVGKAVLAKALLMAGATKAEFASFGGWRKGFGIPSTDGTVPLDYRFGAGEVNIDNSHRILTTNPQQTPSGSSLKTSTGWNYTTINNGATHQYFFQVGPGSYIGTLSCLLTWNRRVSRSGSTLTPSVANLDLRLFEASGFTKGVQRDLSVSTIDNVEHIWLQNLTGGRYLLEVTAVSTSPSANWDYALAWDAQTVAATVPPDLDHDGDVDSDDLAIFTACRTRSGLPRTAGCAPSDFNNDNDVDMNDFATFQKCYAGKGVIQSISCYQP